jgi:PBP1b-binding outer membrane lipoprotein LpoB
MRLATIAILPAIALAAFALPGCGEREVRRTESNEMIDLSGDWNDTDSQLVAKEMIADAMTYPWADQFTAKSKRNPKVQLGKVIVRSNGDDIATDIFLKNIRKEFVRSGKVDVIDADKAQTRATVADQANFSKEAKAAGEEEAADFLLKGTINVQDDQLGNRKVKFYQVDLELTDIQSAKIVWTNDKKIKKDVTNAKSKF